MTDGIEQWVLDLPLWLQTPLVLVVLVLVASALAVALMKVGFAVPPATDDEKRAFGAPGGPGAEEEGENR